MAIKRSTILRIQRREELYKFERDKLHRSELQSPVQTNVQIPSSSQTNAVHTAHTSSSESHSAIGSTVPKPQPVKKPSSLNPFDEDYDED